MKDIVEFIIYESQHHHIENFWNIFVLFRDQKCDFKYVQYVVIFCNENLWNILSSILKERI